MAVSCVEEKAPYRAHPYNLLGKNCTKGICIVNISPKNNMVADFPKLGIECVKRKDMSNSLMQRKTIKVDPFKQGFQHMTSKTDLNLNSIRLCFQVFLRRNGEEGTKDQELPPVLSNVINDKRTHEVLKIFDISDNSGPVEGGKRIVIFTSKVVKEDIEIHFAVKDSKLL